MPLPKSDSTQLLVSLVVEHSRRSVSPAPPEGSSTPTGETPPLQNACGGEIREAADDAWRACPEKQSVAAVSTALPRQPSPPARESRSLSSEAGSAKLALPISGVVGACFLSGTALAADSLGPPHPVRFEVTAADTAVCVSSANLCTLSLDALRTLPSLASLREISLASNRLRRLDLRPLAACRSLQTLLLHDNQLEGIDLSPLAKCPQLERLWLHRNDFKCIDLSPLAIHGSNLRSLYLGRNRLVQVDLSPLQKCCKLRALHLDGNAELRELDVTPLFACPELSAFEAPPHARLLVREEAALEAQQQHRNGQQREDGEWAGIRGSLSRGTKVQLPKAFRRRNIVLHWIRTGEVRGDQQRGIEAERPYGSAPNLAVMAGDGAPPADTRSARQRDAPAGSMDVEALALESGGAANAAAAGVLRHALVVGHTTSKRLAMAQLLEHGGQLRVTHVPNLSAAFQMLRREPLHVDLILLDPVLSELFFDCAGELVRLLRVPVIVIGPPEYEASGMFQKCMMQGATGYMVFPLETPDSRILCDVAQARAHDAPTGMPDDDERWANALQKLNLPNASGCEHRGDQTAVQTAAASAAEDEREKWSPSWWRRNVDIAADSSATGTAATPLNSLPPPSAQNVRHRLDATVQASLLQLNASIRLGDGSLAPGLSPGDRCRSPLSSQRLLLRQSEWRRIEGLFNGDTGAMNGRMAGDGHSRSPQRHHGPSLGPDEFAAVALACNLPACLGRVLFERAAARRARSAEPFGMRALPASGDVANGAADVSVPATRLDASAFYAYYRDVLAPLCSRYERLYRVLSQTPAEGGRGENGAGSPLRTPGALGSGSVSVGFVSRRYVYLIVRDLIWARHQKRWTMSAGQHGGSVEDANWPGRMAATCGGAYSPLTQMHTSWSAPSFGAGGGGGAHGSVEMSATSELERTVSTACACVWFYLGGGARQRLPIRALRRAHFAESVFAAERGAMLDNVVEMLRGGGVVSMVLREYDIVARLIPSGDSTDDAFKWTGEASGALHDEAGGASDCSMQMACADAHTIWSAMMPVASAAPPPLGPSGLSRDAVVQYCLESGTLLPRAVDVLFAKATSPGNDVGAAASTEAVNGSSAADPAAAADNDGNAAALPADAFAVLFLALGDPGAASASDVLFSIMDADMDGVVSPADVAHFYLQKRELLLKEGIVLAPPRFLWHQIVDLFGRDRDRMAVESAGVTAKMMRSLSERRRANLMRCVLYKDDGMALVDIQQTMQLEDLIAAESARAKQQVASDTLTYMPPPAPYGPSQMPSFDQGVTAACSK
ncbi:hypothetical protein CDCA_CDCA14G3864 [Cyanidium caldarium]|uniref:Response regulatory domain-containing protein n=1 Tax=Cyanidium caldarium TaxID=2771 RepID=A0AAV9J001_CYACA|nr:hypothetical protein CDCA_CDCA14G3864 [Cyanidium caldarium]